MKLDKLFLFSLIIGIFCNIPLFSQKKNDIDAQNIHGIELCNYIFEELENNGSSPSKQYLVQGNDNEFPYNITITLFPDSEETSDQELKKDIIFMFNQKDFLPNQELIISFIRHLENTKIPVTVAFSYGDAHTPELYGTITGPQAFVSSLSTNLEHTVIIVELNAPDNKIITSSSGKTSPSWLVEKIYNIALENKLKISLPFYYLSQIYTYSFSKDKFLDYFFGLDIPSVKLSFSNLLTSNELILEILENIADSFNSSSIMDFDQHFFIQNLFGRHYYTISEKLIVYLVIFVILGFLLFISLMFFIDAKRHLPSISDLKSLWYTIPFTFLIIIATLFLGRGFYSITKKTIIDATSLFYSGAIQLFFACILNLGFYYFEITRNKKLNYKTIDYLVIVTTFLNQFLFIFVDISLFPIFAIVCITAIICLYIKNDIVHVIMFLLMCAPFMIYIHILLSNSPAHELKAFLDKSMLSDIAFALLITPLFLEIYRIYIKFSQEIKNKKLIIIIPVSLISGIFISLIISGTFIYSKVKSPEQNITSTVSEVMESDKISCQYSDNLVFDDIVRTINIQIPEQSLECQVILFCPESSAKAPILYSDNVFEKLSHESAQFIMPVNPPDKFSFTYGTSNCDCEIFITVISEGEEENQFIRLEKTVKITNNE